MKLLRGKSIDDPIIVERSEFDQNKMVLKYENFTREQTKNMPPPIYSSTDKCDEFLSVLFGPHDYSYFVKSQSTLERDEGVYHIYNVEDADSKNHLVFFLIKK